MSFASTLESPHARSGLFALVFAPAALVLLGSSMADVQAQTAIGQPLASVEGLIGMALATIIVALVSMNCDESPAGMIVTSASSVVVGACQGAGLLRVPLLQASLIDAPDMRAAVAWSLYPVAVTVITGCAAAALARAGRPVRGPRPAPRPDAPHRTILRHRHAWVAGFAIPAALLALLLLVDVAPWDTTEVASLGLSALAPTRALAAPKALAAALLLGLVALLSRFSLTGPQAAAWFLMALPGYAIWPLWTSISGAVVTPGPSPLTALALASPVVAALGMLLGASTIGVYWARARAEAPDSSD